VEDDSTRGQGHDPAPPLPRSEPPPAPVDDVPGGSLVVMTAAAAAKEVLVPLIINHGKPSPGRHCHSTLSLSATGSLSFLRDLYSNLAGIAVINAAVGMTSVALGQASRPRRSPPGGRRTPAWRRRRRRLA
jgi:hypothetical protein